MLLKKNVITFTVLLRKTQSVSLKILDKILLTKADHASQKKCNYIENSELSTINLPPYQALCPLINKGCICNLMQKVVQEQVCPN